MSRIQITIWLLLCSLGVKAQMFPISDHAIHNPLVMNPAYSGCLDALSASMSYRNQWAGIDNAPKSRVITLHAPVHHNRIGLGLVIDQHTIGIFRETGIYGNYAFRRELAHGIFALGLGFGVTWSQQSWNKLVAADADDAELITDPISFVLPNFSLGTWYYTDKFHVGFSMPRFLGHEEDPATGRPVMNADGSNLNLMFMGGTTLQPAAAISLHPSALLRYMPGHDFQADVYVLAGLADRVFLGLGYRTGNILIGMLDLQLNNQCRLAYAYDFSPGGISRIRNGSHEFSLRYTFSYQRNVPNPRQL